MNKEKKEKLKYFLLKCLFYDNWNNLIVSLLYIPFLIIGMITQYKHLILLGGLGVVLLNNIIKKVVKSRVDLSEYDFNKVKKK